MIALKEIMISLRELSKHPDIWLLVQIRGDEFQAQSGDKWEALFQLGFYMLFTYQAQFPSNQKSLQDQIKMTKTSFAFLVCANWWILFATVLKQGIAAPTHW